MNFLDTARGSADEFIMSGLAGTGKTTTMMEILRNIREAGWRPAVCTPTGKAAHVINKKFGGQCATTLHKVLTQRPHNRLDAIHKRLDHFEQEREHRLLAQDEVAEETALLEELEKQEADGNNLFFTPRDVEDFLMQYDVLVFDEASMIGSRTYDEFIKRLPVPRIFIGDGAQLPPVKDSPAVNWKKADVRLGDILRQGKESGILQFAHKVHAGNLMSRAEMEQYDDLTLVKAIGPRAVQGYEDYQILVPTNEERHAINPVVRLARGFDFMKQKFPHLPMIGETLMVDQNNENMMLLKGQTVTVTERPQYLPLKTPYNCRITCVDEVGRERTFDINLVDMTPHKLIQFDDAKDQRARRIAAKKGIAMQWSYAITCHKAQGSEWDNVLIIPPRVPDNERDRSWWYTAATRARKHLVVASYRIK